MFITRNQKLFLHSYRNQIDMLTKRIDELISRAWVTLSLHEVLHSSMMG
jgi:hypothetical protein